MENHIEETSSKHDKGFTLVELLIVIVILGILATITVFAVRGITDKGTTSACAADKNTMAVAVESYFANNGGATIPIGPAVIPNSGGIVAGTSPSDTLVKAGLLRAVSVKYMANADGTVSPIVPVATNPCP